MRVASPPSPAHRPWRAGTLPVMGLDGPDLAALGLDLSLLPLPLSQLLPLPQCPCGPTWPAAGRGHTPRSPCSGPNAFQGSRYNSSYPFWRPSCEIQSFKPQGPQGPLATPRPGVLGTLSHLAWPVPVLVTLAPFSQEATMRPLRRRPGLAELPWAPPGRVPSLQLRTPTSLGLGDWS